jgi:hypothetical protein
LHAHTRISFFFGASSRELFFHFTRIDLDNAFHFYIPRPARTHHVFSFLFDSKQKYNICLFTIVARVLVSLFVFYALGSSTIVGTLSFKKVGIDKESRSHEHALFTNAGISRERDIKGIGIGKDFRHHGLGSLDNLANKGVAAVRFTLHAGGKDVERDLATTTAAARIPFRAAIHAESAAARGLVHNVQCVARRVIYGKGGDAKVAILLDIAQLVVAGRERCVLVAAALAATNRTSARTINRHELRFRVHFLDLHLETITYNRSINENDNT